MRNIYNLIIEINNFDETGNPSENLFIAQEILDKEKKLSPLLTKLKEVNFSPTQNSISKILSEVRKMN